MTVKIVDFAAITRSLLDLGKPQEPFHRGKAIAEALQDLFLIPETERFTVCKKVAQQVCSLAESDMLRMEMPPLEIVDKPKLYFLPDDKIGQVFVQEKKHTAYLDIALHRSGVLLLNMHMRFTDPCGIDVSAAIEDVRMNLRQVAIKIPERLASLDIPKMREDRCRYVSGDEGSFFVGTFKDFASEIVRPLFIERLKYKFDLQPLRDNRCISSTLVQIYRTDPECTSVSEFLRPDRFGREMRGVGTMDRNYESRNESVVVESFAGDLSADEEAGVYTMLLSDLIIFDSTFDKLVQSKVDTNEYRDPYSAMLYYTTHYSCILEWVYLEKYLINLYNRMLSRTAVQAETSPEMMLSIQKESMHDLIGYKAGITPYPSREDFWEKARIGHRIPDAQEKMEKKRDLATAFVLQEYTLRTNRSIQLVNIFISATATFGLMEVILSIAQEKTGKVYWGICVVLLFAGMLFLLWGMNKLFMALARKKA